MAGRLLASAVALMLISGTVHAAEVMVVNGDFSQGLAQNDNSFVPGHVAVMPGWTASGGSGTGHWNPSLADFEDEAVHGGVGWAMSAVGLGLDTGVLGQVLTGHVLQANTLYTLTFDAGRRFSQTGAWGYDVGLISAFDTAGSTILARATGLHDVSGSDIAAGRFGTVRLSFQTGASGPQIGKPLAIALGASAGQGVAFDNLKLEAQSLTAGVPEPATWAMMIGGFGLVGGALRRRKLTFATI